MPRLIDADVMYEEWLKNGENEFAYDTNAFLYSIDNQPIEELCEVVHQLSRMLQGNVGNLYHLAEEIADARIMLDQMELAFDLTEEIREWEERKLTRLQRMVEEHG